MSTTDLPSNTSGHRHSHLHCSMQEHTPPPRSSSYDALDCRDGEFQHLCLPEGAAARVAYLDASKNQLSSLQEVSTQLQGLKNLQQLVLSRNRLADVAGLQQLPDLRMLDLSRNKVTDLQPLQALSRLETLDLHSNCISSLDPICMLTNLLSLNAAGNRLQELPCQLTGLSSLTELNLRHNCLTSLAPAAAGRTAGPTPGAASRSSCTCCLPGSLRRLSLACNQLQDISILKELRQLPSLLDLCVDGNPFTAASHNKHLAACAAGTSAPVACGSSGGGSSSSSGACWYRESILLASCTPALLRRDGLAVLPAERALLLTSAASLQAAAAGKSTQGLATVLQTQQFVRLQSAPALPPAAASDSNAHLDMFGLPVSMTEASAEPCAGPAATAAAPADTDPAAGEAAAVVVALVAQQQGQQEGGCSSQGGVEIQRDMRQQQQHRRLSATLQHQGSLREAAVTCGVDVPLDRTTVGVTGAPTACSQQRAGASPSACSSPAASARPSTAAAVAAAAAAEENAGGWSPGVHEGVFSVSDAEVQEFLQVQKARLLARTKSAAPPPPAPAAPPGMELAGSCCVLTGPAALRLLRGEGLAGVTELTLAQVAWAEVLEALPSLLGLRRLRALSLVGVPGLSTLPQLHPLLQLRRLAHLSLQECEVCSLVLLRPYVVFRFGPLASFNGRHVSSEEVAAAGALFGGLEATLDAALDQAPQQAALAPAGIQLTSTQPQPAQAAATHPKSDTAALLQKLSLSGAAAVTAAGRLDSAAAGDGSSNSSSRSARVTQVLAAMQGPLLPPGAVMQQGRDFAQQLLAEAAVVQQQLSEFLEVTWPGLLEAAINEAWSGHLTGAKPVAKAGV